MVEKVKELAPISNYSSEKLQKFALNFGFPTTSWTFALRYRDTVGHLKKRKESGLQYIYVFHSRKSSLCFLIPSCGNSCSKASLASLLLKIFQTKKASLIFNASRFQKSWISMSFLSSGGIWRDLISSWKALQEMMCNISIFRALG